MHAVMIAGNAAIPQASRHQFLGAPGAARRSTVHATRGKYLRAEPVAALYAQVRVKHVRPMAEPEDQMCDFGPDKLSSGASPDRLDALVWAVTELTQPGWQGPRIRGVW